MNPVIAPAAVLSLSVALATLALPRERAPSCHEVTSQPAHYLGTKVSLVGIQHGSTITTVDGHQVGLFIYACSDDLGHQEDDSSFFAFDPKAAAKDASADSHVAQRVTGVVQLAAEVPMPMGRLTVNHVMPYLTAVAVQAP